MWRNSRTWAIFYPDDLSSFYTNWSTNHQSWFSAGVDKTSWKERSYPSTVIFLALWRKRPLFVILSHEQFFILRKNHSFSSFFDKRRLGCFFFVIKFFHVAVSHLKECPFLFLELLILWFFSEPNWNWQFFLLLFGKAILHIN